MKISEIAATGSNGVTLRWPSVDGKHYRLLGQTGAFGVFNQVLRTNIAATPPFNTELDTNSGDGLRLYRLELEP